MDNKQRDDSNGKKLQELFAQLVEDSLKYLIVCLIKK